MFKKVLAAALLSISFLYGMSVEELNSASKEDLIKIKGIGEAKAKKIIAYREKNQFESLEDVTNVNGIGPALAKVIKEYESEASKK